MSVSAADPTTAYVTNIFYSYGNGVIQAWGTLESSVPCGMTNLIKLYGDGSLIDSAVAFEVGVTHNTAWTDLLSTAPGVSSYSATTEHTTVYDGISYKHYSSKTLPI